MALTRIKTETYNRLCPLGTFCDDEAARIFLADLMADIEESNPVLFDAIYDILFGRRKIDIMDEAWFDAALCGAAICRLYMAENALPVISQKTYESVIADYKKDGTAFHNFMMNRNLDMPVMAVVAVCSANYKIKGRLTECLFVQCAGMMIYRMIELQSEQ